MDEEKKRFKMWLKMHKKELIFAGVSVGVIIAVLIGIKNGDHLIKLWRTMKESIKNPIDSDTDAIPIKPAEKESRVIQGSFDVSEHIRNLPPGMKASAEKSAEAMQRGIKLSPGQTLVDGYTKGVAA